MGRLKMTKEELLNIVKFDKDGLVPVIAQDYHSKHIRMLAYMNKEALTKTLETGDVYYYSRSRQKLWLKGEESGHFQHLKGMSVDCDGDTLLIQIEQVGGVSCHTGNATCFYRNVDAAHTVRGDVVGAKHCEPAPKIPHMGWNSITNCFGSKLFDNLENQFVYFVHSYHLVTDNKDYKQIVTNYGYDFCSAIEYKNIFATQFHPEKSGEVGLSILKTFSNI